METTEAKPGAKCACVCHKMFGVFIALAGGVGLLAALGVVTGRWVGVAVSGFILLAGLQSLFRGKCNCCNAV